MKRLIFTLLSLVGFLAGYSQMTNNGGTITVENGANLVIEGNYTNTGAGTIDIDGTVTLKGNLVNNGSANAINTSSFGKLKFNGASGQEITGSQSNTFYCSVEVDNAAGVALTSTSTGASQVLDSTLILTNGKVTLNGFDLTLSNEGVTAPSATRYVVTNSTGQLKAPVVASNYLFPVGSATNYNPVILNEAGTSDVYGVNYSATTPANWSPADHAVVGTWTITEGTPSGNNLAVTPGWSSADDQANFDPTDCAVGRTTDNGTTIAWKASGAASGPDANGIYTRTGSGFTGIGQFVVGDYWFEGIDFDIDLFLAGPYSSGAMSTAINSLIPDDDPYGNGVNNVTVPATAVDWIEVELRNSGNPATVTKSYSFFVDNGGNVLNVDGTVGAKLTGVAKSSYYLAVRHRNHLGAMTASAVNLASGPFAFDFTAGSGIYGTNAMRNLGGGEWALWAGDTDGNGSVQFATGTSDITPISAIVLSGGNTDPTIASSVMYNIADADLNGTVQFATGTSDITPISATVLSNGNTDPTIAKSQQLP